jgi:exopolyphosphatase/guanosine-5'-triphosphate,3'-diphosphate pyrophosphatase
VAHSTDRQAADRADLGDAPEAGDQERSVTDPRALRIDDKLLLPARTHLGVIDLGSNAIRLQVARVFADSSFAVIHDEREPVRLGEEVFRRGELSRPAIERALETLARFAESAHRHGTSRVRAVATAAVREARNGAAFAEEVERTSGLKLEIISGREEAELIARGVLTGFNASKGRIALVDVGGGSTEISVVDGGRLRFSTSLPIGSVRLTELFCHSDPLSAEDEGALRAHVREQLANDADLARVEACPVVVGSAGTIGAIANFIRKRPSGPRAGARARTSFSVRELRRASSVLRRMTLARRRRAPGIEERRSEIIVAGTLILEEICAHVAARSIRTVRRGLRDGLMLDEIERFNRALAAGADESQRRPIIRRRAPREAV